jgi:transcriptional regulator with XRE-family HTH domain
MASDPTVVKGDFAVEAKSVPHTELRALYAEWLRQGMEQGGWNQSTLSREAGVSRETVGRVLHQLSDAEATTLEALAEAMDYPLPTLIVAPGPKLVQSEPSGEPSSGLRYESGVTAPQRAAGELAASAGEVAAMVGDAVGRALRRVIATNELEGTRAGRRDLVLVLRRLAHDLHAMGADVSDLFVAIDYLQGDKRDEGRDP